MNLDASGGTITWRSGYGGLSSATDRRRHPDGRHETGGRVARSTDLSLGGPGHALSRSLARYSVMTGAVAC